MRDPQLDEWLKQLRQKRPNDFQLAQWKRAVRKEWSTRNWPWPQMLAASLVGLLVGGLLFGRSHFSSPWLAGVEAQTATIEYIFTKTQ